MKKTVKQTAPSIPPKQEAAARDVVKDLFTPVGPLGQACQSWYSLNLPVVRQILPERYSEFVDLYRIEKRKNIDFVTYGVSDFILGTVVRVGGREVFDSFSLFSSKFRQQLDLLQSCIDRLDSALSDIQGTLEAELFDDELNAARELKKKGHLRAAGALAGVTLERHLGIIARNRQVSTGKRHPTISDFNEAFKNSQIYDVPTWRFIQLLGDLRNLSVHSKGRDPTKTEIDDLITGVEKILKTVL